METIIRKLEDQPSWKESMRKTCRANKLNIDIVAYYTPLRFRGAYSKFKAIYEKKSSDKNERWIQNQLKAFYWICVAISCVNQIKISQFTEKEWEIINEIFYFKQALTLEYEGKKLLEDTRTKQNWSTEQDLKLSQIVQQFQKDSNKWNEFARRLYQTSEKRFYRTGKQCRERWLNHLDPSKKHGEWTKEQDIAVTKLFLSEGKRWSQVAKKLGEQRTQHMVKNRFKTIISKQKKQYPRIRGQTKLLQSFLDPAMGQRYSKKDKTSGQFNEIKQQYKSQQVVFDSEDNQDIIQEQQSERQQNHQKADKNLPHTSCTFELPPVYSPWYVNIPITPTFSPTVPFFVNLSTFSAFDANFSSQFYSGRKTSDKLQKIEQN